MIGFVAAPHPKPTLTGRETTDDIVIIPKVPPPSGAGSFWTLCEPVGFTKFCERLFYRAQSTDLQPVVRRDSEWDGQ